MCRRIINYPKSSRKSEIEKNGYLKKSADFGQFWYSMVTVMNFFLKISWIFKNLKLCVGGASSLGTIFWVSGSVIFIWGTSWGPHHGCVNATKLEIVSVFFFSLPIPGFGEVTDQGPDLKINFSGWIFEPRLDTRFNVSLNYEKWTRSNQRVTYVYDFAYD